MDMREMMERAGNSHLLTVLSYKNAGHLIEPPFTPFVRASTFRTVTNPPFMVLMALWGGELVAHSHAQEDAWRKTLVFLRENLYGGMKHDPQTPPQFGLSGCDEPPVIPVTQDHRAAPHRAATRTLENCEKRKNVKLELLRPRSSASSYRQLCQTQEPLPQATPGASVLRRDRPPWLTLP
ncbi:hypothetical protein F7725_015936 [Dissostichus mawsoni]|uniref:BAAT/Acyl-CoA thioester hydrolase C-terminal domain-containing protein n=1 Tax=Dissostichus mawsoni TaxID=36200 RepID=A0A7J5Y6D4_DISMA|nr:hypothetical protein F7725_015936 [Dissostichus mawsoni]